jgi:hypothetical protein
MILYPETANYIPNPDAEAGLSAERERDFGHCLIN